MREALRQIMGVRIPESQKGKEGDAQKGSRVTLRKEVRVYLDNLEMEDAVHSCKRPHAFLPVG
jgi:hypothetical protein